MGALNGNGDLVAVGEAFAASICGRLPRAGVFVRNRCLHLPPGTGMLALGGSAGTGMLALAESGGAGMLAIAGSAAAELAAFGIGTMNGAESQCWSEPLLKNQWNHCMKTAGC